MNSKLLFNQIKIHLPRIYGVRAEIEEDKLSFYVNGKKEFYVRESGGVSFEPNCTYNDATKNLSDMAIKASKFVRDYLTTIETAPDFKREGVGNNFKLIAHFNNTVLAARTIQNENVEFVTWETDSSGVSAGHYFGNNFIGAKEDFAIRSEIISRDKIFTTNELVEIYKCIQDTLNGEYELINDQYEILWQIQSKICNTVQNLAELIKEVGEKFESDQNVGQTMM